MPTPGTTSEFPKRMLELPPLGCSLPEDAPLEETGDSFVEEAGHPIQVLLKREPCHHAWAYVNSMTRNG